MPGPRDWDSGAAAPARGGGATAGGVAGEPAHKRYAAVLSPAARVARAAHCRQQAQRTRGHEVAAHRRGDAVGPPAATEGRRPESAAVRRHPGHSAPVAAPPGSAPGPAATAAQILFTPAASACASCRAAAGPNPPHAAATCRRRRRGAPADGLDDVHGRGGLALLGIQHRSAGSTTLLPGSGALGAHRQGAPGAAGGGDAQGGPQRGGGHAGARGERGACKVGR